MHGFTDSARRAPIYATLVAAGLALTSGEAAGGGLYVTGHGAQAQGRAGAFVAKADDPSALFYNPAGFARGTGTVVHVGVNLLDYSLTYRRAGTYEAVAGEDLPYAGQPFGVAENDASPPIGIGSFQAVPLIAVSTDLGLGIRGLRFGAGIFAPQAYPTRAIGADYQFEAAGVAPPPGRYDVVTQESSVVFPSLAVAYQVNDRLDVGARLSWGVGDIAATTYVWGVRNYEEWVGRDSRFALDVSDHFVPAFGLGALYRVADAIEVGFAYNSAATVSAQGTGNAILGSGLELNGEPEFLLPIEDAFVACAPGGTAEAFKACVEVPLARTATLGARYVVRDGAGREVGDVELDLSWENWSSASDFTVIVDVKSGTLDRPFNDTVIRHGLRDVLSARLGGSYRLPMGLGFRGGVAYDTAAAPDSWTRLDYDGAARTTLAAGLSYERGRVRVDVGGGVALSPDRSVAGCQTTLDEPSCAGGDEPAPSDERDQPDPIQPLEGPRNQLESPFNAGDYESGYLLLSAGVTVGF